MTRYKIPGCALAFAGLLVMTLGSMSSGCRLTQPGSASFASVVVTNQTLSKVLVTTAQVFRDNGYVGRAPTRDTFVFDREGTRGEDLAYGGVAATHEGEVTKLRVNGKIVDLGSGKFRIQCEAFMIRDAKAPIPGEPTRLPNFRRGPYQKLLDEAAKRLQ